MGDGPPPSRVAVLGTGIMGGWMARRLVAAGHDVAAWNRTPDKAAATGARVAPTAHAALQHADVAITMLSTAATIDDVLFGPTNAVEALRPGSVLVVMSSIPVEACRAQAARMPAGVGFVDAPVSGGERGARDGTLAILGGGTAPDIGRIAPVMQPLGRMTHVGPLGSGQLAKLANQIIVGGTMVAVAEALHFARAGGADPAALQQALLGGFADSTILREHGRRMVQQDFQPGGPARYQLKDLRAAQAQAETNGMQTTLLPLLIELFGALDGHGEGGLDVSAVWREIGRRATPAAAGVPA